MTGASISIEDAELREAFRRLIALGENPAPMLQDIGDMAVRNIDVRFFDETAPGGGPWKPSLRAQRQGGKTLTLSGRLGDSMMAVVEGNSVRWGTNIEYAGTHQFGATIRPKTAKALHFNLPGVGPITTKSVTIPARPFIGWDAEDVRKTTEVISDHFTAGVQGKSPGPR